MGRVRAGQGFNPCPICGTYKGMLITSREAFYRYKERFAYESVHIGCYKCKISMWSTNVCKSGRYMNHVAFLAGRWNKLANTKQAKESE